MLLGLGRLFLFSFDQAVLAYRYPKRSSMSREALQAYRLLTACFDLLPYLSKILGLFEGTCRNSKIEDNGVFLLSRPDLFGWH